MQGILTVFAVDVLVRGHIAVAKRASAGGLGRTAVVGRLGAEHQ